MTILTSLTKILISTPLRGIWQTLSEELMQVVGTLFAANMMFYYPPGPNRYLAQLCSEVFQDPSLDSFGKMAKVWKRLEENVDLSLGLL